jgi:hypothetical protein
MLATNRPKTVATEVLRFDLLTGLSSDRKLSSLNRIRGLLLPLRDVAKHTCCTIPALETSLPGGCLPVAQ